MISTLLEAYIAAQLTTSTPSPTIFEWDASTVLSAHAIPTHDGIHIAPVIDAKSAIIVDLDTGMKLFERNAYDKSEIASITKLMTAIIILEENDPEEIATVSQNAAQTEGSKVWLYPEEQIRVKNLLYALLIHSANDAAIALAEHNAGSVEAFVEKMNSKAEKIGLLSTHFSNPVGFDSENNFSTAYDISILARYAFKKNFIRHAASISEMEVTSVNGNLKHKLETTNQLIKSEIYNVKGLKTGHTEGAGLCLTSVAENSNGNRILTVVLDSPDRFQETKSLIDWTFKAYTW